ncbi:MULTISPECIES: hypothetical protein [Gemella]|uniref:hypothetical protein n=1 Tax=Gemella TaxID=1378 RepID=UPI0007684AD8|nr:MULTISPECIES: hypothetical protein [Gemella]AME09763.1 hypothetical protein AXE85_06140 [Gemella sp. oral taxon 928]AXI27362.1 hypothetical protein CG018_08075 [Gemella sp. ND 6198]
MNKEYSSTKIGALVNLISGRNYEEPMIYKFLYYLYYLVLIIIFSEILFDKSYMILSVLGAYIFINTGRNYEDKENHIIQYLPLNYKIKIQYIYFIMYLSLIIVTVLDFITQYFYNKNCIIEYLYMFIVMYILSNIAVVQMIMTKYSPIWFFIVDTIVYVLIIIVMCVILSGNTLKPFNNNQFNSVKLILLIVLAIIVQFICLQIIKRVRK